MNVGGLKNRLAMAVCLGVVRMAATAAPVDAPAGSNVVCGADAIPATPSKVELRRNGEGLWRLYVNDREFPIRGAGGDGLLDELKQAGGNCVRTWGIDALERKEADGERLIDKAYRLGLMVVPGIWVQHERHLFDYSNPAVIKEQRERVLASVRKYKNHPAVLVWGLGNEMEGCAGTGSVAVLKEVGELAKLVKAEDPAHPVMTVIAYNPAKVPTLLACCPDIDILGVNTYGGAAGTGTGLKAAGWKKPFVVTEFGVTGFWEVPATEWGAPFEATSQEKAGQYYAGHKLVFEENDGKELCLGTIAFLWGWKQEKTGTWFGMFLPTREKLAQVDAMTKAWTGHWPTNRCPKIGKLISDAYGKTVKAGSANAATVEVMDPEGDTMAFDWSIMAESTDAREGGDAEAAPPEFPASIRQNNGKECVFTAPDKPGPYRLFVVVHDNKGSAATANFPFRVE